MKKIFIDCGGYDGCSVRKFRKEIDKNIEYDIVSFEANFAFSKNYSNFKRHTFYNKAVWITDGYVDFFLDQKKGYGSSIIKEKKTGNLNKDRPQKTECIRISKYINSISEEYDEIILKLDVEGAEYEILEDIISTGAIKKISKLLVEWHYNKINLPESNHIDLVNRLNKMNIIIEEWDAIGY